MPRIELETTIEAAIDVVFDLSRSIDFHQDSLPESKEKAIAGRMTGLLELNESVTWEASHLGIRQKLTSRITAFERPVYFRDSMVSGAFKRFDHDHRFQKLKSKEIRVVDVFDYDSPLGLIGKCIDILFLERYMRNLIIGRNRKLKKCAESDSWQSYLRIPNNVSS